ncbi:hypothetical protein [Flavobacterium sp.]|uniref:hypothetical protein n=1 Tax=Flavobacterium sp. TaxID=239 RepID=UPI0039E567D0
MQPNFTERLWRVFQSKFDKLTNELTEEERKSVIFILGLREEIEDVFHVEDLQKNVHAKIYSKRLRGLSKNRRQQIKALELQKAEKYAEQATRELVKLIIEKRAEVKKEGRGTLKEIKNNLTACENFKIFGLCH